MVGGEVNMREEEWKADFAHNLRRVYKDRGYDQKSFAEALGVSEMTISRYRTSKRVPDAITLVNMATILDCDIRELITVGVIIE